MKQEMLYSKREKYVVKDSLGNYLREFDTYKKAFTFLIVNQRYDWQIIKINTNN